MAGDSTQKTVTVPNKKCVYEKAGFCTNAYGVFIS